MPVFEYEALNGAGTPIRGIIDAESARIARIKLRGQGVYPTEVREETLAAAEQASFLTLFRRVGVKDLARASR